MAKRTDAELMDVLFGILSDAAADRKTCPTLRQLTFHLQVNHQRVERLMTALEEAGRIRRHGEPGRPRRVEIVATGAITAPVAQTWVQRAMKQPVAPRPEDLPPEVLDAKLYLQRRNYVVYRAWVNDGPRDMWVVQGKRDFMTDAALMDFARARGWQQSERRAA